MVFVAAPGGALPRVPVTAVQEDLKKDTSTRFAFPCQSFC